uniref:Uncharacterized protein n=1 Tax=Moniliophthora roreri TaxID=221103 RepID=A0A0W0FEE0_MONRR
MAILTPSRSYLMKMWT